MEARTRDAVPVHVELTGEVFHWRGPSPYHFVAVPEAQREEVASWSFASYGWGCLPVRGRVGVTEFETALFPRDGSYVIPLKDRVRRAEGIELGDEVTIRLELITDR